MKKPLTEVEVDILSRLHRSNAGNQPLVLSKREGSALKRLCDKGYAAAGDRGYKVTHKGTMAIKEASVVA